MLRARQQEAAIFVVLLVQERQQERLLGREIAEDALLGQIDGGGDGGKRCGAIAVGGKQASSSREDCRATVFTAVGARANSGTSRSPSHAHSVATLARPNPR